jgi:hypothetical protein
MADFLTRWSNFWYQIFVLGKELVPEALAYFQYVMQIADRDSCTDIPTVSINVSLIPSATVSFPSATLHCYFNIEHQVLEIVIDIFSHFLTRTTLYWSNSAWGGTINIGTFHPFYKPRRPLGKVGATLFLDLGTRRGWGLEGKWCSTSFLPTLVAANWHNTHTIYQVPLVRTLLRMSK